MMGLRIFGYTEGARSCAKPRRAFAKKFGRKFQALIYVILSICYDLRTFWRTLGKRIVFFCFFLWGGGGAEHSISWAGSAICCILYWLNLQICNYTQKRCICRENSKYVPDENLVVIFTFTKRQSTSATPRKSVFSQNTLRIKNSENQWKNSEKKKNFFLSLIGGIFVLKSGLRFLFWEPEVPEPRVRKRPLSLSKVFSLKTSSLPNLEILDS